MSRGHRSLGHTADIVLQAWAPSRDECLAEAVIALVESFADTSGRRAEWSRAADLPAGTDQDTLLAALDEVIFILDTEGAVPVSVRTERTPGGLRLDLGLVALDKVQLTGTPPKAITLHGLRFGRIDSGWSCEVIVDI
ncbi:archease [Pseudonocardia asaccharolytica]|uniref:Archease domain-containing protein n=1 Tax=Pseudonocardia asaccharolytica DSM 44247 = NBRC 16224 TaxID=1123024 RepID=A0A511D695_9PSEU|nr:archease [Pseudonocardia asaccharolytica]GEL18458.1 hypothetical protein PA7_22950 [Pseudonocardia asaccharolytica DSM 44247 = NBRC 16224]